MSDRKIIEGGAGHDTATIAGTLGDFELQTRGRKVILTDRLTGEKTVITRTEEFQFDNDRFSLRELRDIADADEPTIFVSDGTQALSILDGDPTISVEIDRLVQALVIEDGPGPTVASRAYAMVHTAAYDAWSAFDEAAERVSFDGPDGDNATFDAIAEYFSQKVWGDRVKEKAMAFAAYEVMSALFPDQQATIDTFMTGKLGYALDDASFGASLGRDAAQDLLALRQDDGANHAGGYVDTTGYTPVNPAPDAPRVAVDKWTPEYVPIDGDDNLQTFLTPHWGDVEPFALPEGGFYVPEPVPFFTEAHADAVLDFEAKTVDLNDGNGPQPITRDMIGPVINQAFIDQAEVVIAYSAALADEGRMSAEFYEDAGGTAFPPGTWMSFGQYVSARDGHTIEQDAKMFLALSNAALDAGVATWGTKAEEDYARPVRAIRDLGHLGLIGDEDGIIEAFRGFDPVTGEQLGTGMIHASEFVTYQRPFTDASPPFAEYTSGHSAYSAAGAAVLTLFTGSDEFGGSVTFEPGSALFAPDTPSEPVTFAWDTFADAADAAGLSRLYGGIHFEDGDFNGRTLGKSVGLSTYATAKLFWIGAAQDSDRPFHDDLAIA